MESLRDISNKPAAAAPTTLKTFERKKKASASEDSPGTPVSAASCASPLTEAPTTCSSPSCSEFRGSVPTWLSSRSSVLHKGRCSSVLHAAAVPGHNDCREVPASRSLFLQKMSKARRKAYLAYIQQMAEYFAEVDEFELLEESSKAATALKTNPKSILQPADGTVDLPFAHQPTPASEVPRQQVEDYTQDASHHSQSAGIMQFCSERSSLAALATPLVQQQPADANEHGSQLRQVSEQVSTCWNLDAGRQAQPTEDTASNSSVTTLHHQYAQDTELAAATPLTGQHNFEKKKAYQQHEAQSAPLQCTLQQAAPTCESPAGLSLASCTPASTAAVLSTASLQQQAARDDTVTSTSHGGVGTTAAAAESPPATETCSSLLASAVCQQMQQLSVRDVTAAVAEADHHKILQQQEQGGVTSATPASNHKDAGSDQRSHRQQPCKQQHTIVQDLEHHQQAAEQVAMAHQQWQHMQELEVMHMEQQLRQCQLQQQGAQLGQLDSQQLEQLLQQAAAAATAQQLAELQLAAAAATELTPLQHMLRACNQPLELEMIPSMKDFVSDVTSMKEIIKLGEGTYGEAFKAPSSGVVFKLVPMEGDNLINGYEQKKAGDLLAEAIIASTLTALSEECDPSGQPYPSHTCAFVKTYKVGVCRGPYPQPFIKAWNAWDDRNTSENDPVAKHPKGQLYAVFAMADCGRDLEGYHLRGFDQARSMMLQVAVALAIAEDCLAFEHRDLHWGNVMLTPATSTHVTSRFRGSNVKVRTEGVAVSLIDFTASRLQTPAGDVAFCDLEAEEGIFDGPKGKPQFETYRRMRKVTRGDWSGSHPGTNVMWMLYLAELLLSTDKPIPGATAGQKRELRNFKKRVTKYSSCGEVIWDELFQGLWNVGS